MFVWTVSIYRTVGDWEAISRRTEVKATVEELIEAYRAQGYRLVKHIESQFNGKETHYIELAKNGWKVEALSYSM